ncbi:MAG TPA: hypothetical protein VLS94_08805 [Fusibacter sp.]|nr:hypothetical protein [Fusibacter sp.]
MKIKFDVNNKTYELTSDKYQMILNEIAIVKTGENVGNEYNVTVGYFKNEFQALQTILDNEKYNSECTSFAELEQLTRATLDRLNEICDLYKFKK